MKKMLFLFLVTLIIKLGYSQEEYHIYFDIKNSVISYLDSIITTYPEHLNYSSEKVDYLKNPYSISKNRALGINTQILNAPTDSAEVIYELVFGEFIYIPMFKYHKGKTIYQGSYDIREYEFMYSYPDNEYFKEKEYVFCFSKTGQYGFIESKYVFLNNLCTDNNSQLLEFSQAGITAYANLDLSKVNCFNSIDYCFNKDQTKLIYSQNNEYDSCFQCIYEIDLITGRKNHIANGFSPVYFENSIAFWTRDFNKSGIEEVHIYDFDNKTERNIFSMPFTMGIFDCDPHFIRPQKIKVRSAIEGYNIIITFCYKSERKDRHKRKLIIDTEGEIISVEI